MLDTLTSVQKIVLAAVLLLAFAAALVSASGRLRSGLDAADETVYVPPVPGKELVAVHVIGAVVRPGLYRLAAGSRVQDAVSAAGGFASDARADSLNLAAWLTDGEQLFIETRRSDPAPVPSARPAAAANAAPQAHMINASAATPPPAPARPVTPMPAAIASPAPPPAPKPLICINTAGLEELQELPGVGPTLAMRILYHRHQNGRFRSFNDLADVKGIGSGTIEAIRTRATLN